jgi:hypothetical protein
MKLELSRLPKTWIIDLDGTIVQHNGYKNKEDVLLDGVEDFFSKVSSDDCIVILTARKSTYKEETINFLKKHNLRFDHIIFDLPVGERILINDDKPSGLIMGHVVNKGRDLKLDIELSISEDL